MMIKWNTWERWAPRPPMVSSTTVELRDLRVSRLRYRCKRPTPRKWPTRESLSRSPVIGGAEPWSSLARVRSPLWVIGNWKPSLNHESRREGRALSEVSVPLLWLEESPSLSRVWTKVLVLYRTKTDGLLSTLVASPSLTRFCWSVESVLADSC